MQRDPEVVIQQKLATTTAFLDRQRLLKALWRLQRERLRRDDQQNDETGFRRSA